MMNTGFDFCLALHRAHANLQFKLDDELGTYHGISFSDFVLLNGLAQADRARASISALASPLGQPLSVVLRQLLTLEKIGLVLRDRAGDDRLFELRPAGRALMNAAHETVGSVSNEAVASIHPSMIANASTVLAALVRAPTQVP